MKETDWKDCINSNSAKLKSKDILKSKSLIETAKGRINYANQNPKRIENRSYIFENYYTSLIEILHAKTIEKGFKITNHICLGYFLRDKLNKPKEFRIFTDLRIKRNLLIYYGKKLDLKTAQLAIKNCKYLIGEIQKS